MIKKLIALVLSLLLLMNLAACSQNGNPVKPPDSSPAPSENTDPAGTPDPVPGPEDSQTPEDGQMPEDGQTPEDGQNTGEPAETSFRPGTVEDSTYTSEFLGLTLTLEDGWIIADEQQLAQLAGLVSESFDIETLAKALENGSVVYDYYAFRTADNASVNITVQEMGKLGGILIDEDAYADANLTALPNMLAEAGITVDKLEKTAVDLAGSSHPALVLEGSAGEVPLFETIAFLKAGSYMAVITAATYNRETPPQSLLELFRPAEEPQA